MDLKKKEKIKIYPIDIDFDKSLSNKKRIYEGIEVYFPYEPYPPQEKYMEKIILTLKNKGNISALESPTGTGKTLCLLCSVLAWIKHNEDKKINIYYCTRTISQIKNIMHELNKTCYKVRTSFLSSRKHACLQFSRNVKKEMDSTLLTDKCKFLKQKNKCIFYKNKCSNFNEYNDLEDIEDLFEIAKKKKFCPYYYNLEKSESFANLTFLSYNYILNPFIRKTLNRVIKENSIIILDEAHNINNIFEGLFTKKIDLNNLKLAEELLQFVLDNIDDIDWQNIRNDKNEIIYINYKMINAEINNIKKFIKKVNGLKEEIDISLEKIGELDNFNFFLSNCSFFNRVFKDFSSTFYENIIKVINNLMTDEEKLKSYLESKKISFPIKTVLKTPKKIYEFLFQLNNIIKDKKELSFKFIIHSSKNNSSEELNLIFEIYCIDASYGMKSLLEISPYSVILTSGTLSIDSLENLLDIKFKEALKNAHVIKKERFQAHIIKSIKMNNKVYDFDFSYKNRNNLEQIENLGKEILNLIKTVKYGGILVFFQSYEFLNKCYSIWSKKGLKKKFTSLKKTIFDLFSSKTNNESLIEEAKKENNLLLFTVHRGTNSEGINFPDDQARMVICIGFPFPNLNDIKVKLKMDYLNKKYGIEKDGVKGWNWIRGEASIAVNQSLGRLLRSVNDYGVMICFGKEFKTNKYMLSEWIQKNITFIDLDENKANYYKKIEDFLTIINQ